MSTFYAISFRDGKIGVLDTRDNVTEYYAPNDLIAFLNKGLVINGVTLATKLNPIFTLNGLTVNLAYPIHKQFGNWVVALLRKGDRYGSTLSSVVKEDTLFFYYVSDKFSKPKYPLGQFVSSYYLKTILSHTGGLILQMDEPLWRIDEDTMNRIKEWASN